MFSNIREVRFANVLDLVSYLPLSTLTNLLCLPTRHNSNVFWILDHVTPNVHELRGLLGDKSAVHILSTSTPNSISQSVQHCTSRILGRCMSVRLRYSDIIRENWQWFHLAWSVQFASEVEIPWCLSNIRNASLDITYTRWEVFIPTISN